MKFTKYNNPNKRRARKRLSKTDADILATKNMLDDRRNGIEMPLDFYEWQSMKNAGEGMIKMNKRKIMLGYKLKKGTAEPER